VEHSLSETWRWEETVCQESEERKQAMRERMYDVCREQEMGPVWAAWVQCLLSPPPPPAVDPVWSERRRRRTLLT